MLESLGALVLFFLLFYIIGNYYFGLNHKIKRLLFNRMRLSEKVAFIIKTDLSSKYARCKFYINNDYTNGYTQAAWQTYCQEKVDNTLDKNSQEYAEAVAPIVNAIVVGGDGYLLRRGMENMEHSLERFLPGVNDRISLNYFVEPYEYVKDEKLAAKSQEEEQLRKKRAEEEAPKWAARARCANCIHENRCSATVKLQTGSCGGYTPRR